MVNPRFLKLLDKVIHCHQHDNPSHLRKDLHMEHIIIHYIKQRNYDDSNKILTYDHHFYIRDMSYDLGFC